MMNHLSSLFLLLTNASSVQASDPVRSALESTSAKWFRGVWISGVVVAIGCGLEVWETYAELTSWWRGKRGLPQPDERPGSWRIPIAALGLLLVIGGVGGETIFEVLVSNSDTAIRTHESEVLSLAETKTAIAEVKASDAERKVATLNEEASILNKKTEDERLARVRIESAVSFRQLCDEQEREIGNSVSKFRSLAAASVWFNNSSTEAELFADDIAEALRDGHLIVQPPGGIMEMRESGKFNDPVHRATTGVVIQSTKHKAAQDLALTLVKELNRFGFDAVRQTNPPFDDNPMPQIWVTVEPRPKGPQGEFKLQAEREARAKSK